MDCRSPADTVKKRKAMYKLSSPVHWKESYKQRCAERLRNNRSKLLNRFRNVAVDEVMNDEFQLMQEEMRLDEGGRELDFDDILRCMEEIKDELLVWETETMLNYEKEIADAESAREASMVCDDHVVCPICKCRQLKIQSNVIRCECGLHLLTRDTVDVTRLKQWLEAGVSKHAALCLAPPAFSVVQNFDSCNLLITCPQCDYIFIVV